MNARKQLAIYLATFSIHNNNYAFQCTGDILSTIASAAVTHVVHMKRQKGPRGRLGASSRDVQLPFLEMPLNSVTH